MYLYQIPMLGVMLYINAYCFCWSYVSFVKADESLFFKNRFPLFPLETTSDNVYQMSSNTTNFDFNFVCSWYFFLLEASFNYS